MSLTGKFNTPREDAASLRYYLTSQHDLIDVPRCLELIARLKHWPQLFNTPDANKLTPLVQAVRKGKREIVAALIDCGADVNHPSEDKTALMMAATAGHADILRMLLAAGAKPDLQTEATHQTALHYACRYSDANSMRELIAGGAALELGCDPGNFTPLHVAAAGGFTDGVRLLLEAGADVRAVSEKGMTALMLAAEQGKPEIVRLLLDAGASVYARAGNGETALDHALRNNISEETISLLREAAEKIDRHMDNGLPLTENLPVRAKRLRLRPRKP